MTITLAICAHCQTPFDRKRKAQRACSSACKQALFRSEKCNAGTEVPAVREIELGGPLWGGSEVYARIYPGLKPLSDLECRVMKLRPTDHRDKSGALLYEMSIQEKGPAEAATSPSHVKSNPSKGSENER